MYFDLSRGIEARKNRQEDRGHDTVRPVRDAWAEVGAASAVPHGHHFHLHNGMGVSEGGHVGSTTRALLHAIGGAPLHQLPVHGGLLLRDVVWRAGEPRAENESFFEHEKKKGVELCGARK